MIGKLFHFNFYRPPTAILIIINCVLLFLITSIVSLLCHTVVSRGVVLHEHVMSTHKLCVRLGQHSGQYRSPLDTHSWVLVSGHFGTAKTTAHSYIYTHTLYSKSRGCDNARPTADFFFFCQKTKINRKYIFLLPLLLPSVFASSELWQVCLCWGAATSHVVLVCVKQNISNRFWPYVKYSELVDASFQRWSFFL